MGKLDITSTALEKATEIAHDFLDRLVGPAAEELGLLVRDRVTLWKFKNQVRVLTKAKEYCEANGISPAAVSLKLLCPLLEHAALEEDEGLQDKWAVLLSNLVDSEQNIQNHVFPYILSQLSSTEFAFLERVYADKRTRVERLTRELVELRDTRPARVSDLRERLAEVEAELARMKNKATNRFGQNLWPVEKMKWQLQTQLRSLDQEEASMTLRIGAPETLPDQGLREFEVSNLVRLGLAREVQETYAHPQTLDIPLDHSEYAGSKYVTVDVEVELESERQHVLTELGDRFLKACTERRLQHPPPPGSADPSNSHG